MTTQPLLQVRNLEKRFPLRDGFFERLRLRKGKLSMTQEYIYAVNGISFTIARGSTVCLVGESGCGKSTVARCIVQLHKATAGEVHYDGQRIDTLTESQLRIYRTRVQMIFQNPYASLNPRFTIGKTLTEPVKRHFPEYSDKETKDRVSAIMSSVGVNPAWVERYPHELSGGQRQRINIARALSVSPQCVIADEPISALDVSIQAQILNLLIEARETRKLTYLFITHDLSVVRHFGEWVIVMYLGRICEVSPVAELFSQPKHPYTQILLGAIPQIDKPIQKNFSLQGDIPAPTNLPTGCVFHPRCMHASERCRVEIPQLQDSKNGVSVACHAYQEGRL